MVAAAMPPSIENLHRIESFGLLAKFRRIKLNANTCDLSTAASKGRKREINAAGPKKRDDRDREMFFLLRMAFWLGLVLVLLPRDKPPEMAKAPQIGASEAISAATAAVSDMTQFCKRQPAACEVGGQAATAIGQRAQGGARKLYEIITEKRAPDHTGSIDGGADADPSSDDTARHDTLTPDDLAARWHVPPAP